MPAEPPGILAERLTSAHKKLKFDTDARHTLERGVNKLAGAVKATLGPEGQHGIFEQAFGGTTVTSNGVTIARQIEHTELSAGGLWTHGG